MDAAVVKVIIIVSVKKRVEIIKKNNVNKKGTHIFY